MLKRLRNKKKKRNRGDLMEERDLEDVGIVIKLPRYLKESFKQAVKSNLIEETTVNENLVKYIISVVGNYNKSLRNY